MSNDAQLSGWECFACDEPIPDPHDGHFYWKDIEITHPCCTDLQIRHQSDKCAMSTDEFHGEDWSSCNLAQLFLGSGGHMQAGIFAMLAHAGGVSPQLISEFLHGVYAMQPVEEPAVEYPFFLDLVLQPLRKQN